MVTGLSSQLTGVWWWWGGGSGICASDDVGGSMGGRSHLSDTKTVGGSLNPLPHLSLMKHLLLPQKMLGNDGAVSTATLHQQVRGQVQRRSGVCLGRILSSDWLNERLQNLEPGLLPQTFHLRRTSSCTRSRPGPSSVTVPQTQQDVQEAPVRACPLRGVCGGAGLRRRGRQHRECVTSRL